jgi:hypothetical protein
MERTWDKIDADAEREGEALQRSKGYSPTRPNIPCSFGLPKRIFDTDKCHRIESLSVPDYVRCKKAGDLKRQ